MYKQNAPCPPFKIREHLIQECHAMAEYSFANGLDVPVNVATTIEEFSDKKLSHAEATQHNRNNPDLERLVKTHQILATLVKPALPRTILLLNQEQHSDNRWSFLGPVSIIRQLMIASFLSLLFFVLLALSPNVKVGAGNILQSNGLDLLQNLLFYISAAGLGAGFAGLYKANAFITQGTFDPTYHASYWIRFCLGLIAGLVLSVMVSDNALGGNTATSTMNLNAASGVAATSTLNDILDPAFLRPMLAMLGGFSADLLYTVLNRLVETVESLFKGSTKNFLDLKQQEAESRLAISKAQGKIEIAAKLLKLQQDTGGQATTAEIQSKIDKLLSEVMQNSGKPDNSME